MTIGKQLRQARESRNLSLEQVAQATHIRVRYLQALEAEQFELLPSTAQLRGFLRAYAGALKLDPAPLLAALEGEIAPPPQAEAAPKEAVELLEGSPEAIFGEIGARLKSQRELLGLSLEDVERHNYATFLGLDCEALLLRFADGLQARLAARQPERGAASPAEQASRPVRPSMLRRLLSADFLAGGAVVIFLIGFCDLGHAARDRSAHSPASNADGRACGRSAARHPHRQPGGHPHAGGRRGSANRDTRKRDGGDPRPTRDSGCHPGQPGKRIHPHP